MRTYLPALLLLLTATPFCKEKNKGNLNSVNWFLGSWSNTSKEGKLVEVWQQVTDSSFYGNGSFIINNDTVFSENIRLIDSAGKLFYIVSVKDQNKGEPVAFQSTKIAEDEIVFENPAHDFPKKIVYRHPTKDSMIAEIL